MLVTAVTIASAAGVSSTPAAESPVDLTVRETYPTLADALISEHLFMVAASEREPGGLVSPKFTMQCFAVEDWFEVPDFPTVFLSSSWCFNPLSQLVTVIADISVDSGGATSGPTGYCGWPDDEPAVAVCEWVFNPGPLSDSPDSRLALAFTADGEITVAPGEAVDDVQKWYRCDSAYWT